MNFLGSYKVIPSLPAELEPLRKLAYNLHWSWNHDARKLFRRLDSTIWDETRHNPVKLLGSVSQERLEEVAKDDGFISHMRRVYDNLENYLQSPTWFTRNHKDKQDLNIVYFSFEFGLTECLQTYSGGLGVLAGDHLKSASDLGLPLVGIGVNFKDGYFQQFLTSDGYQQERYEKSDFDNLPMKIVHDDNNEPMILDVDFPEGKVYFQIWKIEIGRIPLYLMDTNIPQNNASGKEVTQRLYGGNKETRIRQEILLGMGGLKTVHALGIEPSVCHMNEGHAAFFSLARITHLKETAGLSFEEAKEAGYHSNIFTTHTPVPAGIDIFGNDLVEKYFKNYYHNSLKLSSQDFYALGNLHPDNPSDTFNMAHLALNTAGYVNGVSKLHGVVSRKMWEFGFRDVPINEIPISSITNGVHTLSHLSPDMCELLVRYLGDDWIEDPAAENIWDKINDIPDEELWRTHERRRERLVAFARKRLTKQVIDRGGNQQELLRASEVLNPSALTIGFARRFATYKRATLIFRDIDYLANLLNNPQTPVQIIIAGKAHPQDEAGKAFIKEIFEIAHTEEFRRKIVFLENYDMNVARYMVEGCDIWLNNPRRPMEASGTSGMKVLANGGLNFSVLDGWWDEAYSADVGWKIGTREEFPESEYQDEIESREIYSILEREVIPLFYEREVGNIPRKWIGMVKKSMKNLAPQFNTSRMVKDYLENLYLPAHQKRKKMSQNNWELVRKIADWKQMVERNWNSLKIMDIKTEGNGEDIFVGQNYKITADIELGELTPDDVEVQLYYGPLEMQEDPSNNKTLTMEVSSKREGPFIYTYTGSIMADASGAFGFTIRIVPKYDLMINPFEMRKVFWANK